MMRFKRGLAVMLLLLLGACNLPQGTAPQPFPGAQTRPAVISKGSPQARPIIYCPPVFVAQGQRVMAQLARVRLGADKLTVQSLLGTPLRAESFLLMDGGMAEVMYYPTPGSACGRADAMLPMVFQNGRLIGYGPDYYQNFVVPTLKTPLQIPAATQPVAPAPSAGAAYPPPMQGQNLAPGPTSRPYADYTPDSTERAPQYQLSPEFQQQYQPAQNQQNLGRGTPLN